ncbi:hypothetical protein IFM89_025196 [Coptis chinensis]|uniref:Protein kinase domain-containing protein n=1 Tax=Coptis chinensis TaxID=261450 RepID=A0A835I3A4_9MAGN|nr:hypothetical protein IFM89_025196 [Coptis chinensis]
MKDTLDSKWEDSDSSKGMSDCVISSEGLDMVHGDIYSDKVLEGNEIDPTLLCRKDLPDYRVGSPGNCANEVAENYLARGVEKADINLRQWLDKPERSVDDFECLHIFRQVVEIVNLAHSRGIIVHNVRPSCFAMSAFNHVSLVEPVSCSSRGGLSDFLGHALNRKIAEGQCTLPLLHRFEKQRSGTPSLGARMDLSPADATQRGHEIRLLQSSSTYAKHQIAIGEIEERKSDSSVKEDLEASNIHFHLKQILLAEINWYSSPEEVAGAPSSFSSDIYRLGVLLFELFSPFSSNEEKLNTMSNLGHRVLPPQLLLKWPKEASFCLWLLHPHSSTRPKMSELLKSEFLNEPREEREAAINLSKEIEEQELLLDFLLQIQQRKKESASMLHERICWLSSDIEEVLTQKSTLMKTGGSQTELSKNDRSASTSAGYESQDLARDEQLTWSGSRKRFVPELHIGDKDEVQMSETLTKNRECAPSKSMRLMKNSKKLESIYFSTRCRIIKPTEKFLNRCSDISSKGVGSNVISFINNLGFNTGNTIVKRTGWINPFLQNLNNYLCFSKLKVQADLDQGDLINSSNLVCSINFDRDRELFATAGVARKIKVFEYDMILNKDRGIHYPVIEMASRSKLSSICWNSYIKSQIASCDFEGVVQIWDVTRGQVFMEMKEHEKRVWSVDFSLADPTKLASGSDDGAVKLWNINQAILLLHLVDGGSIGTIRTKANVCCVQFPPNLARSLVFGSADHKIYCYDLRNTKMPWCTLMGHTKTVSYVKFIDSTTLVSASTDNSLKLWDLSKCTSEVLDSSIQTFTGHTNVKNFVGLSVYDGYIATGSETNEVFIYHKAFPMPMISFDFSREDSFSGHEIHDATQFVSSVCWRGQSSTLVAANSTGNIKLLEMV